VLLVELIIEKEEFEARSAKVDVQNEVSRVIVKYAHIADVLKTCLNTHGFG